MRCMVQDLVDSIGIAAVIFVILICPLLLFVHTLGSRWRGVGWASAWLGLSFIPILLVVMLLARTASDWVELSANILCIPLTGVAGLLCRGASSRAAKALRLQRWFIVGALVALSSILVDRYDPFAVLAIPYAAAYCNLLSLVMLALGCGLRIVARPIVRRGRARGLIRAKRRLRRLMPALYAVGCAAALLFTLGMSAREHARFEHERQALPQRIQQAGSAGIYEFLAPSRELSAEELTELKRLLTGLERTAVRVPHHPRKDPLFYMTFFSPTGEKSWHSAPLMLCDISPAGAEPQALYTLPPADLEQLRTYLHELRKPHIQEATSGYFTAPGIEHKFSDSDLAELKSIFAHVEWDEYGEHILTEQEPGVLHFSGGTGTQAYTGILLEHISSTDSGQNTPYRLPESDYQKLLNCVRRVTDGGFSTETAPGVPHPMQP